MSVLLHYRKLDSTVTLRVDAEELTELARDLHSSALIGTSNCTPDAPADLAWRLAGDGGWEILLKAAPWGDGPSSADAIYLQSDGLLDDLVRERAAAYPLLHAGAVALNQKGVVICGGSGSGKTSLVLAAILRGWNWLSDELLCFRQQDPLSAEGVRRNFNLKQRSFGVFPETAELVGNREFDLADVRRRVRFLNPDALPGGRFVERTAIHAFVVPEYASESIASSLTRLTGPALIGRLVSELNGLSMKTVSWLGEVGRSVPVFLLSYASPHQAVDTLAELIA